MLSQVELLYHTLHYTPQEGDWIGEAGSVVEQLADGDRVAAVGVGRHFLLPSQAKTLAHSGGKHRTRHYRLDPGHPNGIGADAVAQLGRLAGSSRHDGLSDGLEVSALGYRLAHRCLDGCAQAVIVGNLPGRGRRGGVQAGIEEAGLDQGDMDIEGRKLNSSSP